MLLSLAKTDKIFPDICGQVHIANQLAMLPQVSTDRQTDTHTRNYTTCTHKVCTIGYIMLIHLLYR